MEGLSPNDKVLSNVALVRRALDKQSVHGEALPLLETALSASKQASESDRKPEEGLLWAIRARSFKFALECRTEAR